MDTYLPFKRKLEVMPKHNKQKQSEMTKKLSEAKSNVAQTLEFLDR